MEATVLSMGKSVVSGAVSYAQSAVAKEVALQLGVQRDQAFIRDELEMMQSFLMAAHDERDNNKVIKTWVKQVRDLGYDVEDCLQDFVVRFERSPSWWRILSTLLDRRHVALEMKDLRAKVEDVSQRNLRYHLIRGSATSSKPLATVATEQYAAGGKASATMFGVDKARRAVKPRVDLAQLINKELGKDLRVIAVWGTCGVLGQASVIRHAYDDSHKFECRAWIKLTHPFDPIMFMQSIMRQFYGYSSFPEVASEVRGCRERASTIGAEVLKKMLMMKQEDLVDQFKEHVNNKSYLIVLNDLCSIEDWDWIRTYFPVNSNGNRIIVATQHVEVASLCIGRKCRVSKLKQLSDDQTFYVFYPKSPQGGAISMEPESTSSATAIVTTNITNSLVPICEITVGNQTKDAASGQNAIRRSLSRILSITAAMEGSEVVGRETEKSHILRLILNPVNKKLQVISVWGMSGLGKTALVEDIYESQELNGIFEKHAFLRIIGPFSHEEFLRSLAIQLGVAEASGGTVYSLRRNVEELMCDLERFLREKRCLIVLDGLSSTTEWDMLMNFFYHMKNGSQMIVTTREVSIANYCSNKQENVCKLNGLDKKHHLSSSQERYSRKMNIGIGRILS
ncbi:hypothetical protein CFC21_054811 [Triticum aestivum]|uniref:NB-ARC domain-containing protein n=2 Tax=Triticum aestivum TaxID=4565 RepID=A0A3B6I4Z9_WHEAT|nr:hypothetical protein CFC21_054811 [Triticum aestivum]